MADHNEVMRGIERHPGVRYPVLTPNLQGFHNAVSAFVKDIHNYLLPVSCFPSLPAQYHKLAIYRVPYPVRAKLCFFFSSFSFDEKLCIFIVKNE